MADTETSALAIANTGVTTAQHVNKGFRLMVTTAAIAAERLENSAGKALGAVADVAGPAAEYGGRVAPYLAVGATAIVTVDKLNKGDTRGAAEAVGTGAGGIAAGMVAGSLAGAKGAALATVWFGPEVTLPAMVVCGLVGGAVGGIAGSAVGKKIAGWVMDAVESKPEAHAEQQAKAPSPSVAAAVQLPTPQIAPPAPQIVPGAPTAKSVDTEAARKEAARTAAQEIFRAAPAVTDSAVSIVQKDGKAATGAFHVTPAGVSAGMQDVPGSGQKIDAAVTAAYDKACAENPGAARVGIKYSVVDVPKSTPVEYSKSLPCTVKTSSVTKASPEH